MKALLVEGLCGYWNNLTSSEIPGSSTTFVQLVCIIFDCLLKVTNKPLTSKQPALRGRTSNAAATQHPQRTAVAAVREMAHDSKAS